MLKLLTDVISKGEKAETRHHLGSQWPQFELSLVYRCNILEYHLPLCLLIPFKNAICVYLRCVVNELSDQWV